jgi:hypothetical protein
MIINLDVKEPSGQDAALAHGLSAARGVALVDCGLGRTGRSGSQRQDRQCGRWVVWNRCEVARPGSQHDHYYIAVCDTKPAHRRPH